MDSSAAYRDPARPIEERVEDLLGRMSVEEKVGQLNQREGRSLDPDEVRAGRVGSVLCVLGDDLEPHLRAGLATRLGIPAIAGIDAIHGHSFEFGATIFPTQLAVSCSWRPELSERMARVTALEMRGTGAPWTFSPVCCLPVDLRWGRVGETFGEDPLLIGRFAAAAIRGYQGADLAHPDSVAACAKHFAGYGETVGGLDASEAHHSRRRLRSLFLPPFRAAAEAGAASFMIAYGPVDGVSCTLNRWLLTEVLRGEWGWDGVTVSDWNNVGRLHTEHRVCASQGEAARRAVVAGMDLSMQTPEFHDACLAEARAGRLPAAALDEAVRRNLRLKFRLGLFEDPRLPDAAFVRDNLGRPAHRAAALEAARDSAVLLVNRGVLPLDLARIRRLAVVGPHAADADGQLGDWQLAASQNQGARVAHPRAATVTVLDGLQRRLGPRVEVGYAAGCSLRDDGTRLVPAAVRLAERADACVLVLSDCDPLLGEFKSTATLELMGGQKALYEALLATGTPLVVVFMASKPLVLARVAQTCDALLCTFNPGMEGGTAIAELLCGDAEPAGRLTVGFPRHVGQLPVHYQQVPCAHGGYADGVPPPSDPLFAFGEGLAYTRFRHRRARVARAEIAAGEPVVAELEVVNAGARAGVEVVQCYLHDRYTSATWPAKALKDWRRVAIPAGGTARVRFEIPHEALAIVDAEGRAVVEPGDFELLVGRSARDRDLVRLPFRVL